MCNILVGRVNLQGALEVLASPGGQKYKSRQELRLGRSPRPSETKASQSGMSSSIAGVGWITVSVFSVSKFSLSVGEKQKFSLLH